MALGQLLRTYKDVAETAVSLLVGVAMVGIQLFPQPALALVTEYEQMRRPLYFTRLQVTDSIARDELAVGTLIPVVASGYSSTVDQTDGDPFTTAAGTQVREGIIAANFLPLGTRVEIGTDEYVVEDRMNARFDSSARIDVWFASRQAAWAFGTRHTFIEIVALP